MRPPFQTAIATLWAVLALVSSGPAAIPDKPDFNFHVQPILSDRCYFCHGADAGKRKAGLRLDQRDVATAVLKSGATAVKAGNASESELIKRIFSHDPEEVMPPQESKLSLTDEERETLRRWIEQGAEYKKHWAFEPPRMPSTPVVNGSRATGLLDKLVAAKLQKEGLDLRPEAPRERLLRRLCFDLTGLPPTLPEIDAFVADSGSDAVEKVVDRLLASPAFGERMAQDWLDVARYADTFGYQADVTVQNWPYRDWVINAFNQGLPFDQFITWQIAGDLLPHATRDQVTATAFNRLHRQTNEGGSIEEEFRTEYVMDRVQTFGLAFLGLTLECAKCHDHKFDPVSMKDFYSLFAFFNNIDESGLYSHFTNAVPTPTLRLTKTGVAEQLTAVRQKITAAEDRQTRLEQESRAAAETWVRSRNPAQPLALPGLIGDFRFEAIEKGKITNSVDPNESGTVFDDVRLESGKSGQAVRLSGENNLNFALGGNFTRDDAFSFALWLQTPDVKDRAVVFHRSKAWTDAGSCGYELLIEDGRLSPALIHFWPGNALRIRAKAPLAPNRWTHVALTYDGSSRAAGLKLYVDGRLAEVEVVRDCLTNDINRGGENRLTIGQRFRDRGFKNGLVDEFRIFNREISAAEAAQCAGQVPAEAELLHYHFLAVNPAAEAARKELKSLRQQRSKLEDPVPELMVMQELPQAKPAFVLKRGSYEARGERVFPDIPAAIAPFKPDWPRNRLGLARWVTDPQHPLCARVVVNRFWQSLWGRGLVATAEDFGLQGQLPTHPELLDYLARRLIDGGWSVKMLLREIVLSATYRQDSAVPETTREKDPENLLLSRGPAVRLSAEAIRDCALAASGQIDLQQGGPSVDPDKTNRRSLYTFWKRTMPDVRMEIFDMAKREVCVARRQTTNTPLQALTLLNEPRFLQCCRVLAQNALTEIPDSSGRLARVFRLLTGRHPATRELALLQQLLDDQSSAFRNDGGAAKFLAATGGGVNPALDPVDLAALTMAASAVMNLDECILKR
ncbi:MAG: DUF1553 domain-containing protein [Verrucomicrobiales bacterium]|nr:DUF1553 domain-containing protein [Verrucomicrobiales bacterium]